MEAIQETLTEAPANLSVKPNKEGGFDLHHPTLGKIGSGTHVNGKIKGTVHGRDFEVPGTVETGNRSAAIKKHFGNSRQYARETIDALDRHNGKTPTTTDDDGDGRGRGGNSGGYYDGGRGGGRG